MADPLKVTFYFDTMSPYTYFAWHVLKQYKSLWNLDVTLAPIFLGGVMAASGNTPPAFLPNRGAFMAKDLKRNVKWLGLDAKFKGYPRNLFQDIPKISMTINRFLCVVINDTGLPQGDKWRLVDAGYQIIWEDPTFRTAMNEFHLPDGEEGMIRRIYELAGMPVNPTAVTLIETTGKDLLKLNTEKVIELKAFGAPVFHFPESVDKSIFFGSDRFEQMAFIFGKKWFGPNGPSSQSRL